MPKWKSVGIDCSESNSYLKLCRQEAREEREMKMEKKEITDVRHYRAGICKPSVREETSAGGERERRGCWERVNAGGGLEADWQRQGHQKHIAKPHSCLPSLLEHRQLEKALIKSILKGSATILGAKSYLPVSSPFGTLPQDFLYSSFTQNLCNLLNIRAEENLLAQLMQSSTSSNDWALEA